MSKVTWLDETTEGRAGVSMELLTLPSWKWNLQCFWVFSQSFNHSITCIFKIPFWTHFHKIMWTFLDIIFPSPPQLDGFLFTDVLPTSPTTSVPSIYSSPTPKKRQWKERIVAVLSPLDILGYHFVQVRTQSGRPLSVGDASCHSEDMKRPEAGDTTA